MLRLQFDLLFFLVNDLLHEQLMVLVLTFEFNIQLIVQLDQGLVFLVGLLSDLCHQLKPLKKAFFIVLLGILVLAPFLVLLFKLILVPLELICELDVHLIAVIHQPLFGLVGKMLNLDMDLVL